ncbi:MAG: glucohydrolase, partial [Clostridiales bacterium]|nr:glucohydrolase [Clostridiales bacterium]
MSGGKGKDMEKTFWYKDAVIYQIWPRSFKDADGDGVGDLMGVYEKLDYLKSLHVDAIWFSPLYPSPNADFGYDVADYMDISAEYGGMAAFKKVLDGAHERGIRVIMDLVVNHTSDEHPWFQASRRGEEPYKDYYIWRKPKKDGTLPNNWDSMFEGKAWQYDEVRKAYYLHIFAIKQPDLNMDNPRVRAEVKKILRFWLDMGVDGFREDVITYISKPKGLPDAPFYMPMARGIFQYNNGPHLHEYLNEFRTVLDDYDCVTIGEAPLITTKRALDFIGGKHPELDMMIPFQCMEGDCFLQDYSHHPFCLVKLKTIWQHWQKALRGKGWNLLYIENHDHPRVIIRY